MFVLPLKFGVLVLLFGTGRRVNRLLVSLVLCLCSLRLVVVVDGCSLLLLVLFLFTVFCFSEAFILHSVRGHVYSVLGVSWMVRCEVKEAEIQAPLLSRQLNLVLK